MKDLHQSTIDYIKQFARDHFIRLSGTDEKTEGRGEHVIGIAHWAPWGGLDTRPTQVETVTFYPDQFSFGYKGAVISGPLKDVAVETECHIDGGEAELLDQDDVEGAIEKACGFPIDPNEVEEPEIEL
jgi:hypothetical protein